MGINPEQFCCPKCANGLVGSDEYIRCLKCETIFAVRDGIVDFRCDRWDYYFNPVPRSEMEKLTRELTADNWPETIRAFLDQMNIFNIDWLDNLIVDGRYAWKIFLNLNPDDVLLDLGCGLGNLTSNLAPHVAKVYAMDLTFPRLEFCKKRFSIFNSDDDITLLAGGDATYLPFPDHSLDCVVLSGVLEWVGEGDVVRFKEGAKSSRLFNMLLRRYGQSNPRTIQLEFLKEISRVLKVTGQLFVAIENRLSYEYFTGRPDHHSGLRYGSLMPRFLANIYSILKKKQPYRTYTYSIPGYKRLLRQATFKNIEFFGLSKGYSLLEEIIPAETGMTSWQPEVPTEFKERLKRNKYLVPAYGITASFSDNPPRRQQDQIFARIENDLREWAAGNHLEVTQYLVTAKDKLVIMGHFGQKKVIIKIPFNDAATLSEEQNAALLTHLQGSARETHYYPTLLGRGQVENISYFVEDHMTGKPLLDTLRIKGRTSMLTAIATLLDNLGSEGPTPDVQPLIGELYDRHVTRPLHALFRVIDDRAVRESLEAFLRERLHGISISIGVTHGDFGLNNILVENGRISGLIDWEASSTDGAPILDTINYLVRVHQLFNAKDRMLQSVSLLTSGNWPIAEEWEFLMNRYAVCGINPRHHDALVYLNWLRIVTFRLRFGLIYNPLELDLYVHSVTNLLLSATKGARSPRSVAKR